MLQSELEVISSTNEDDSEYDSEDENSFDEEIAEKFGEIDNDISKTNKALKELRE